MKHRLLLSVRNVAVVYNQNRSVFRRSPFEALSDVSLDVHAGDSLAVLGDNGAGKSTLLKLMAGVIKPDKGTVTNYGANTAMLTVQSSFQPELSGRENILLGGLLLGASRKEVMAKMEQIITYSGIRSHIDVPIRTYSSGMKARLGFSIAHFISTDILLIDEGLGVGDKKFRKKSKQTMQEKICSDQTVVMVSHDISAVAGICTHALILEKGRSTHFGPIEEVMAHYLEQDSSRE